MGRLVDKATKRDDVYELVRLAYAFPEETPEIDQALFHVVQRLGPLPFDQKKRLHPR